MKRNMHRAGAAGFRPARPRGILAHGAFFPAAILCALVAIPAWAALYQNRPALGLWHAREMLFGFGLAVVAGFLLAGSDRRLLALLLAAWVLARFAVLPGMALAGSVGAVGFACLLAGTGAQRFLRGARKGRNRVFGLVLAGMAVAEFLYQSGALGWLPTGQQRGNMLILDLLTLLMLQMGGRVIPAATAGALYRRGMVLQQRVQPWIEAAIGAVMACVIVLDQVPGDGAPLAVALIGAAVLTGMRLIRWRPWSIVAIPELWGLHPAYGWLAAGLALSLERINPMDRYARRRRYPCGARRRGHRSGRRPVHCSEVTNTRPGVGDDQDDSGLAGEASGPGQTAMSGGGKPGGAEVTCGCCGVALRCEPGGACWCKTIPARLPIPAAPAAACLCPNCLRAAANMAAGEASPTTCCGSHGR